MRARKGSKVVIAVLLIIVALLGLSTFLLYMQNQQLKLDKADLQDEIFSLRNRINSLESEKSMAESNLYSLQSKVRELTDIVELKKTSYKYSGETINLPAGYSMTYTLYPDYAGYYVIDYTTTGAITIEATVRYQGYEYTISYRGVGGRIIIPVLPGEVEISFINTNFFGGITVTFDLIYHY